MGPGGALHKPGISGSQVNGGITGSDLAITATAGGNQATGYTLTKYDNNVAVCATDQDAVTAMQAISGRSFNLKNSGAAIAALYPYVGDKFEGNAVDAAMEVGATEYYEFHCVNTGTWQLK